MRRVRSVLQAAMLGGALVVLVLLGLHAIEVSYAQGPITMTKVLNRPSNVVRVGELLSFTISLANNSAFTLTSVTMVDNYDYQTLAFAWADPPHDAHDPASGVITWANVAVPPIPPSQAASFTVYFTAEHPRTTVVNAVRAQDIVDSNGALTVTAETSRTQESIGGAAPVFKGLWPADSPPVAGLPLTFTHLITNDGAAIMTVLPLTDTYDPAFLEFHYAVPTPTTAITGTLVWTDLTDYFGDLAPFQTVIVTTVFTATTQVVSTVNRASTEGAIDIYDNDLTAGAAQVPITIIDQAPTATPTLVPQPTNTPAPAQPTNTPVSAQPTTTLAPSLTPTPVAALLPETGYGPSPAAFILWGALVAVAAGAAMRALARRQR